MKLFSLLLLTFLFEASEPLMAKSDMAQFIVLVHRSGKECFFTNVLKAGQILQMDYLPMSRSGDTTEESNVMMEIKDPQGMQMRKNDIDHPDSITLLEHEYNFNLTKDGEYSICLYNINSWTDLNVFFEMYVRNPVPKDDSTDNDFDDYDAIPYEERKNMTDYDMSHESDYKMKVNDIRHFMMNIHNAIESISFYQSITQASYSRDHQVAAFLSEKVRFYSLLITIIFLGIGAIQVFMVKSLFDDKYFFHKFVK